MWKEMVVAQFGVLFIHLPCGTNENQEIKGLQIKIWIWDPPTCEIRLLLTHLTIIFSLFILKFLPLIQNVSMVWQREVVPGIKGLVWGSYVGSPADPDPVVVWKHQHRTPVASLVPLLTNDVFGLAPQTSLLLKYSKEKGNANISHILSYTFDRSMLH